MHVRKRTSSNLPVPLARESSARLPAPPCCTPDRKRSDSRYQDDMAVASLADSGVVCSVAGLFRGPLVNGSVLRGRVWRPVVACFRFGRAAEPDATRQISSTPAGATSTSSLPTCSMEAWYGPPR